MKIQTSQFSAAAFIAAGLFCIAPLGSAAEDWQVLFDGKTLDGWTVRNGNATFTIEDAAIVGRTAIGSPNSFLCNNGEYGDFELEFDVKVDEGLNSGVQIRSREATQADVDGAGQAAPEATTAPAPTNKKNGLPLGRLFGPQVEIETSPGQSGYIYGEATGRGWISEEPRSKDIAVSHHSHFKNGEWNSYRIVAKGPRIQTWINGQPVADLIDETGYATHPKGFIGLQVHSIPKDKGPFQVAWRNIRIRPLDQ